MRQRWLTSAQAAEYLGLTRRALEKKVQRREIPFSRTGESNRSPLRFDVHQLDEWMQSRHVPVGGVSP